MPSIRRNEAQQQALSDVSEMLSTLKALNYALVPEWQGTITVSFETGETGRNKFARLCFSPGDKEVSDLLKMAQKQKNKMVKEINAKAVKYAIKLDRDDRLIMGPAECAVGKGEQPQPEVALDRMVSEEADQAGAEPERQESEENYAVQGHMEETTSEVGRQEYAQEKPWTPQASALDDPEEY